MVKSEFAFALPEGVKLTYTRAGEASIAEARNILLFAPNVRSLQTVAPLKQSFIRAVMSQNSKMDKEQLKELLALKAQMDTEVDTKENLKADELMAMIAGSSEIDFTKFLESFVKVLKDPQIALIDGEATITDAFLSKMPLTVLETITGEYLANFIAPSVM